MSDIYTQINNERIKLEGAARDEALAHIERKQKQFAMIEEYLEKQTAAAASARAKLAALGLTEAEVNALVG